MLNPLVRSDRRRAARSQLAVAGVPGVYAPVASAAHLVGVARAAVLHAGQGKGPHRQPPSPGAGPKHCLTGPSNPSTVPLRTVVGWWLDCALRLESSPSADRSSMTDRSSGDPTDRECPRHLAGGMRGDAGGTRESVVASSRAAASGEPNARRSSHDAPTAARAQDPLRQRITQPWGARAAERGSATRAPWRPPMRAPADPPVGRIPRPQAMSARGSAAETRPGTSSRSWRSGTCPGRPSRCCGCGRHLPDRRLRHGGRGRLMTRPPEGCHRPKPWRLRAAHSSPAAAARARRLTATHHGPTASLDTAWCGLGDVLRDMSLNGRGLGTLCNCTHWRVAGAGLFF